MNKYEVLYILSANLDEASIDAQIEKYKALVQSVGGEVEGIDKWGLKKFAYTINFKNEGYYVLMNFTAPATLPAEMERQMKIAEEVVRYMVIKK